MNPPRQSRIFVRPLTLAVILGILAACDFSNIGVSGRQPNGKWKDSKPSSFSYTLRRDCFCPQEWTGPFLINATDDSVWKVRRISGTDTLSVTTALQGYSIDSLLAKVREALLENPDSSYIWYDKTFGYPVRAWFDFERGMADEEWGLTVTHFQSHDD
jgi:hypothetical protein